MTAKELELQRAEQMIFDKLPFVARTFVLNSKKINSYIESVEEIIMEFMNEDGLVNGVALQMAFEMKYPKLAEWFSIPAKDFYIKDEVMEVMEILRRIL